MLLHDGGQLKKVCYKCLQKIGILILTHNKLFSLVPANICLVAAVPPYSATLEVWPSRTLLLRWSEHGELEKTSAQSESSAPRSLSGSRSSSRGRENAGHRPAGSPARQSCGCGPRRGAGAARSLQRRLRSLWLRTSRCFWSSFLLLEKRIRQHTFLFIYLFFLFLPAHIVSKNGD